MLVSVANTRRLDEIQPHKKEKSQCEKLLHSKVLDALILIGKENDDKHSKSSSSVTYTFNILWYAAISCIIRAILQSTIAQKTLLALCGDVESNPGPPQKKKSKEKPPDEKQIMKEKVEKHDAKVEEFEGLIRAQAEAIEELKQKQVELVRGVEEQKVEHQQRVEEVKVEAANHLNEMKSAMESQMADQKVQMEANELESKTSMAEMNTELKASQAELIRQQVEGEIVAENMHLGLRDTRISFLAI